MATLGPIKSGKDTLKGEGTFYGVAVGADGREASFGSGRWTAPHMIDPAGSLVDVSCAPGPQVFCAAVDGSGDVLTSTARGG